MPPADREKRLGKCAMIVHDNDGLAGGSDSFRRTAFGCDVAPADNFLDCFLNFAMKRTEIVDGFQRTPNIDILVHRGFSNRDQIDDVGENRLDMGFGVQESAKRLKRRPIQFSQGASDPFSQRVHERDTGFPAYTGAQQPNLVGFV